jgi:transposase
MIRTVLTDVQWETMSPHCHGKIGDPGRSGGGNRLFVEAVLWKARTSSPWRDLPKEFGNWNTVFKRFDDWSRKGVFERIFAAVSDDPDMEYAMIDATIVPVHRHGHGAKGGPKIRPSANRKADGPPKSLL